MIDLSKFKGLRIAVMGLGKTGLSAALSLMQSGVDVVAWDDGAESREKAVKVGVLVYDLMQIDIASFDFIIWSPGIPHHFPTPHPMAIRAEEAGVPLVCDIDVLCRIQSDADYIGITGTNGKSTTTALIGHILKYFRPTEIGGNIGVPVLDLNPLGSDGTYVIEMSSYQLELTPNFTPIGAVLLNITPDHLKRHGDMDGYIAAKKSIFAQPTVSGRKPIAVICIDTDPCLKIAEELLAEEKWNVIPVSTRKILDGGVYVEEGQLYDVRPDGKVFITDLLQMTSLKGRHNHENAACAYAVLHHVYGFEPAHIIDAMSSFAGLQHRQFLVRTINGVTYINDSKATNADATEKALTSFRNIHWILGGQPKEGGLDGLEPYMDRIAHAYLIGEAAPHFAQWLDKQHVPYTLCKTLDIAVAQSHQNAQAHRNDAGFSGRGVVLLSPACASWDQFQSFEHRGQVFADLVMNLTEAL